MGEFLIFHSLKKLRYRVPDAMLVAEQPNPSPETFVSVYRGEGLIFHREKPGSKPTSLTPAQRNAFKPPALQHHQPP